MSDVDRVYSGNEGLLGRRPWALQLAAGSRRLAVTVSRYPLGAAGGAVVMLLAIVAVAAPLISPYDPYDVRLDSLMAPPGPEFTLGTDNLGRDMLSRLIWGSRISLGVAVVAVALGQSTGTVVGVIGGYLGGKTDLLIQRAVDILMAFPSLILALVFVSVLGPSVGNVVLAIALVQLPLSARVMRSAAISVKGLQFVEAARAIGCSDPRILTVHIWPQCVAPLLITLTGALAQAVIVEASLSFLGLGTPEPIPSWGRMLSNQGRQYFVMAPWMAIFPGAAITLTVFGFNLLGDSLRDALDPRLRR
ncbi:MAG: ABC transporter permease [Chloroflexi bacterium]|nr:ABC transporter permease [Chloroflexota bacterium]